MNLISKYNFAKISPQKIRTILHLIKNKNVIDASNILEFINKKSSFFLKKLLKSAISNAENNNKLDIKKLKISNIIINQGPTIKRIMFRAKGKFDKIRKRTSNIIIILSTI